MQKCFYHPTHDAGSTCMGCKMAICQVCRDDGKNGFCAQCFKKVSAIGGQVTDTKKTGMVAASTKATMVKHIGRPTGSMNVTYCFHHFDQVANGTCGTCNRPFCESCLNGQGTCTHCAKLDDVPAPTERKAPPRPAAPAPRRAAPAPSAAVTVAAKGPSKGAIAGVVVALVLVVLFFVLKH
jgi:hypothetical protein